MVAKLLTSAQALDLLAQTPPRIAALIADVQPTQLHTSAHDDDWSANAVLAHLRACADMWGGSILAMLAQDKPTLRAVNPRTWIKQTDYLEQQFQPSFEAFASQRRELLAVLEPLGPEDYSRTATITGAGKPIQRTVLFYADWLAVHERQHLKQLQRIVTSMRM